VSLQQHRRGSPQTARLGFHTLLKSYPTHDRAADALFYVGETWSGSNSDSAQAAYEMVVKSFPNSSRAAEALYKLGLLAEKRSDKTAARTYYMRVTVAYPRSDVAALARDKLQALGR
jgi:TolA-binding protein